MAAPTFEAARAEYLRLWNGMIIRPSHDDAVKHIARRLVAAKARYQAVEAKTGVPWFVIAVIHERESSQNFKTQLGQGDPLDEVSTHVPKGMGPYFGPDAWERAAIQALEIDGLNKIKGWSLERACYMLEKFNGFGYRQHGIHSPYLWSFSNQYSAGKYVADGHWSASAVDAQCGCLPMLHGMMALDPSIKFAPSSAASVAEPALPTHKPDAVDHTTTIGAVVAAGAAVAFAGIKFAIPIAIVAIVVAMFGHHLVASMRKANLL